MGNEISRTHVEVNTDKTDDEAFNASFDCGDESKSLETRNDLPFESNTVEALKCMDHGDETISSEVMQAIIEELTPEGNEEVLNCCVDESLMTTELETDTDLALIPIQKICKDGKTKESKEFTDFVDNSESEWNSTNDSLQVCEDSTEKFADAEANNDNWLKPSDTFSVLSSTNDSDGIQQSMKASFPILPYYKETLELGSSTDTTEHLQLDNSDSYNEVLKSRFPAVSNSLLTSLQSLDIPLQSLIPPDSFQLETVIAPDSLRTIGTCSNENPEQKDIEDENHGRLSYILQFKGGASLYEVRSKRLGSQQDSELPSENQAERFFKRMKMMTELPH